MLSLIFTVESNFVIKQKKNLTCWNDCVYMTLQQKNVDVDYKFRLGAILPLSTVFDMHWLFFIYIVSYNDEISVFDEAVTEHLFWPSWP